MLNRIFKQVIEDVAIGLAAAATPAIINGVQKHGPTVAKGAAEAVKNQAPKVAKAAKRLGNRFRPGK